jgi:cyclic 2,3-diphosphoglycerate synthetase
VVVIDGEHYPPVVRDCVAGLGERFEVAAAAFVGGREKLRRETGELGEEYGVPLLRTVEPGGEVAATAAAVAALVAETQAEVFVDLSDEPVLGYRERFVLASAALAAGCAYEGSDFALSPPPREPFALPSLAVIGTGKRVGKTAVAGHLARLLDRRLEAEGGVVIVAMGRGGPPEPEVVRGGGGVDAQALLEASRRGSHAASDCYEDAVLAGVTSVGCRRCGGGLAGAAYESSVAAALPLVEELAPALAVFEGSGAVVPPVVADGVVCVAGAHQPPDYVTGYLGTYRLLLSDVLVLTMCEPPFASREAVRRLRDAARGVQPGLEVVTTVFRPRPATPVRGRRVAFFSTAPPEALPMMTRHLQDAHGAEVVLASDALADRRRLVADVERAARAADVFLTEIKAAAIDVVAEAAAAAGLELAFCDNEPVAQGGVLDAALGDLGARCVAQRGERPS